MENFNYMKEIVKYQKEGIPVGIYSACTASDYVIEAVLERALQVDDYVLIEATANQVNQYGGYTGMTPKDYKEFVFEKARKINFPQERIILGGDHLGPLTWCTLNESEAMEKSKQLIRDYVLAGFTKIHIDTSMKVDSDDKDLPLSTDVIAERGAILCSVAEEAYRELLQTDSTAVRPVYVVGSEVPIPGGSQQEEESVAVTKVADFKETVETFKNAFYRYNLEEAWENVIAVVVQPGVEFGDETIIEYNREKAQELVNSLKEFKGIVFEGHSTDYQTKECLKEMVEDGIAILKVGPALTFALREGLFALNLIEKELFKYNPNVEQSNFIEELDNSMVKNPGNWKKHYHGSGEKIKYARKYSFSDRCRYYLPVEDVKASLERMITNLKSVEMPLTIIKQYMPVQYTKIREGQLENTPEALIKDHVVNCIDEYLYATDNCKVKELQTN